MSPFFRVMKAGVCLTGVHVSGRNMLSAGRTVLCRMMCNEFAVVQTEGKA